jgi:hypothetical protein
MRAHFAWWLNENWDLQVDPMDSRLEAGHLWDWVSYLTEYETYVEARGESLEEINDAWVRRLSYFNLDWRESDDYFDVCMIVGCLTDKPMSVKDRALIESGKIDLARDEVGMRLDILLSLN